MASTIPQRELRNDNARVIEAVMGGQTFVVTRNGEPVAELRPMRSRRRELVSRSEIVELSRTPVRIDPQRFRDDVDAAIDQSL